MRGADLTKNLETKRLKQNINNLVALNLIQGLRRHPSLSNAALSGVPKGIRLLCLVLPAAERRGNTLTAQRRIPPVAKRRGECVGFTIFCSSISIFGSHLKYS